MVVLKVISTLHSYTRLSGTLLWRYMGCNVRLRILASYTDHDEPRVARRNPFCLIASRICHDQLYTQLLDATKELKDYT